MLNVVSLVGGGDSFLRWRRNELGNEIEKEVFE